MGKKKKAKEISRLRAEVEVLKTRLKEASFLPLAEAPVPSVPKAVAAKLSPTQDEKTNAVFLTESRRFLKRDVLKSLSLSLASFAFILSLKFLFLPRQGQIVAAAGNLYQGLVSKISPINQK